LSFLDKFRRQPEWKHPDPAIRAEAVRRLPAAENHDLLVGFAQADADPVVRRAAVRKLADAAIVIALARADEDEGVREAAHERLAEIARGAAAAAAEQAAAALDHPRHLSALAREATLASVRLDAARRVTGDRALAALARAAEDPEVRRVALGRIADAGALAEVAQKTEHKDTALAALERVVERGALESIAARARSRAAAKRARAVIDERWPAPAAVEPPAAVPDVVVDEAEAARYDELAARQAAEGEERASRVGARVALCEALEALAGEEAPPKVDEATAAWNALPALEGVEGDSLRRRFDAAAEAWRARRAAWEASRERHGRMEALCAELEAAAELADDAEAARRHAEARKAWTGLQSMDGVDSEMVERYARAVARLEARAAQSRDEQARREEEARARLAFLCGQAEELAGAAAPALKDCERVLRDARSALDEPAGGRKDREGLLGRLKTARAKLYARVLEMREAEDWKRWANVGVQEDLCRQVEALLEEKDLPKAARTLRDLDARWKQASQAPKAQGEPLWQRFSAARAQVRARCAAHFSETRAARAENAKKKEALVVEAESLAESTDWGRTAERMRALQAEWRTVGPIARGRSDELWGRFRKAAGRFFDRQKEDRVRRRAERSKSLERREALAGQVEALGASSDWDRAAADVKRLQSEWRATGPVAKDKAEAVAARFQKACDAFFERYRKRDALEAESRLAEREALCARLEALAAGGGDDDAAVAGSLREAQAAWTGAPALSGERAAELAERYASAVDAVVAARPEAFRGTDLDPAANLARLATLCESVEALSAGGAAPVASAVSPATLLAERWREALAANTMGAKVDEGAARRQRKEKVEAARAAWSRVGPIAPGERERLAARFRDACRRALGEGS
jgi:uncharacterized protein DUF349